MSIVGSVGALRCESLEFIVIYLNAHYNALVWLTYFAKLQSLFLPPINFFARKLFSTTQCSLKKESKKLDPLYNAIYHWSSKNEDQLLKH